MASTSNDVLATDISNEKWVRAINWKASVPAILATLSFILSLDGGPSCNFVIISSPLLQQSQHFGLWYYLSSERVAPSYDVKDVCKLYQPTADLGSMWEASRLLWFINIIPCFLLTFTLWRMLIAPISKGAWGVLIATCCLCSMLQVIIISLFIYGHACYGNQMMVQSGTTCILTTGSYVSIGASVMWFITLLTMGYFPPYLKQKNPKHIDDNVIDSISVSSRNNGLIELQTVCDSTMKHNSNLDVETAKKEIAHSPEVKQPPEIDEEGHSFNKVIRKAEEDALVQRGTFVNDKSSCGSLTSAGSNQLKKRSSGTDEDDNEYPLSRSQKSITKLEERFV